MILLNLPGGIDSRLSLQMLWSFRVDLKLEGGIKLQGGSS